MLVAGLVSPADVALGVPNVKPPLGSLSDVPDPNLKEVAVELLPNAKAG